MEPESITVSKMYTFAMPKYVYVQVHGVEKPAKIEADTAEESGAQATGDQALALKLKGVQVGTFKWNIVDGWWIQDE